MRYWKLLICALLVASCGTAGHHHSHDGKAKGCGMSKCSHDEAKKDSKDGEGGCSGGCKH